jgi:hypothetical protein
MGHRRLIDMTELQLRNCMTRVARAVEHELPPGCGPRGKALFVVLAFEDDPGIAQYVRNCQRSDIIKALRETADRLEQRQDVTR